MIKPLLASLGCVILLVLTLMGAFPLGCLAQTLDSQPLQLRIQQTVSARRYVLGPNDTFSVKVHDAPEYDQQDVRIQPDGKVNIFPLGSMSVNGLTVDELQEVLLTKYKFYLNDPKISINLDKPRSFIVYVTGAVMKPGGYELNTDYQNGGGGGGGALALMEAPIQRRTPLLSNILVAAGGISYDADLEHVTITNRFDNSNYEINLLELIENGDAAQDLYLISGDNVFVPRMPTPLAVDEQRYRKYASATISPKSVPVKVYGYVRQPGLIQLDPTQSLNLNSAITSAGGYLADAAYAPKEVFLSRVSGEGRLITRKVDPRKEDVMLFPNDVVYVPQKLRPKIGLAFDYAARLIAPAAMAGGGLNSWALFLDPTRFQVFRNP